ncbi:hypothetical protein [Chryseobacterium paludis]|uniref:hypothetical protein n=1 Tax=Chryseobacterium paludis TaxID=2956784 RepID=UPI0021BF495E|nr:hypothetical protein [Chryseobacterium paludis]
MIVTNKQKIVFKMRLLLTLLILNIFLMIAGYVLRSLIHEDLQLPLLGASLVFLLLIISRIIRLRVFHFENTGAVFSIKSYHPVKRGIIFPSVDYPVNRLRAFKIEKSLMAKNIVVEVNTQQKENPLRVKLKASNITDKDYMRMINSFT